MRWFFFQAVVVFKSYQYTPLTFGDYNYPDWGIALWWVVCMIPILAIPGWATYRCIAVGVKASTLSHILHSLIRKEIELLWFVLNNTEDIQIKTIENLTPIQNFSN